MSFFVFMQCLMSQCSFEIKVKYKTKLFRVMTKSLVTGTHTPIQSM